MANIIIDESKLELIADKIIFALNEQAQIYNPYEYGLPTYSDAIEVLNGIVKGIILDNVVTF